MTAGCSKKNCLPGGRSNSGRLEFGRQVECHQMLMKAIPGTPQMFGFKGFLLARIPGMHCRNGSIGRFG
jgi:hypothetical protein